MSESNKKNESIDLRFDDFAKKYGVTFDGSIKVPYDIHEGFFELFTLHYLEKQRTSRNAKWLSEQIVNTFEKCKEIKEIPKLCETFREVLSTVG